MTAEHSSNDITDEALVEAYRQGNDQALVELIERHFRSIYSYTYRFVRSAAAAEDVTQEVFIKFWRQVDRFKPGFGLHPWLFRIARNTAIDYMRKKKSTPLSHYEDTEHEAIFLESSIDELEEAMSREERNIVSKMVESLPVAYREVIILRAEQGLTFEEVGEVLSKPLNTVKSLYRRGLAKLHQNSSNKRTINNE